MSSSCLKRAITEVGNVEPPTVLLCRLVSDEARQRKAGRGPAVDRGLPAGHASPDEVIYQERVAAFMAVRQTDKGAREPGEIDALCDSPATEHFAEAVDG